ncbi:bifunctional phosphoglucose/phosphomannose isomerase, partial [Candidatus Bathyarchaeota archaeon]|nr:bifunctional phosphoglucose/phosphomannose isomerase [Candidatus Bathyarchaeota archaeon]
HYENAYRLSQKLEVEYPKPEGIIVAGMGGSAIGGEILKDWSRDLLDVPVEVCRDYNLPAYAGRKTLVFTVSYSGETEETLSAFIQSIKRRCLIVCIGSGGSLIRFADKIGLPYIKVPDGMPPRAALPYLLTPMLVCIEKMGLVSTFSEEMAEALSVIKEVCEENSPEKPLEECFAKDLASKLNGKIPVVYGFGFYRSVVQRFKQQFNENSKVPSKWEVFPELNHNEIVGWEKAQFDNFSAVIIRDKDEPEEIRNRIEATKKLIDNKVAGVHEIWSRGKGKLAKILSTVLTGDFTSVYLAILRGVDPTPVRTIDLLKSEVAKLGIKDVILRKLNEMAENH